MVGVLRAYSCCEPGQIRASIKAGLAQNACSSGHSRVSITPNGEKTPIYRILGSGMWGLDNPLHIALLVVILLLVFGAKRVPEIGRSLGNGLREFKQSITGETSQPTLTASSEQTQQPVPIQPAEQVPVKSNQR